MTATREVKEAVDDLLPRGALDGVADIIRRGWIYAARLSLGLVADQIGVRPMVDLDDPTDPMRRTIAQEVAKRIVAIDAETRRRVAGYVGEAVQGGYSPQQLAGLIQADASGAFGKARALVIARTESGTAYNLSSLAGYRATDRVEEVMVFDGDDCGWTSHDDPDTANGSVRTLDEAEAQPLSHPNCVRAFTPRSRVDTPRSRVDTP